jgi:poly-beta-1,6-N-acetyl-D-glucosamine synthase
MTIYFLIVFGIYFVLVLLLLSGWQVALGKSDQKSSIERQHKVSVVVPFRNEEGNLARLLEGLLHQSYSLDSHELIFVDDHSTDQSNSFLSSICAKHSRVKLLHLTADQQGKKKALDLGIAFASGEIIVTTDADCMVSKDWLTIINTEFQHEQTMMAIGAVKIEAGSPFFSQLQAMEFASLIGSTVATLNYGFPTMCNGANLAFRKSAFVAVNGYEGNFDIPSGDDEFLMKKVANRFKRSVSFISEANSVVSTQAHLTLSRFFHQRIRWAGKWKFNQSVSSKILAIFIFVFQFSYLALLLSILINFIPFKVAGSLMLAKLLLEFLFLNSVTLFLRQPWRWRAFFGLQFLYPVYVLWVALRTETSNFEWKGRQLEHKSKGRTF